MDWDMSLKPGLGRWSRSVSDGILRVYRPAMLVRVSSSWFRGATSDILEARRLRPMNKRGAKFIAKQDQKKKEC